MTPNHPLSDKLASRSVGTIIRFVCRGCGHGYERKIPMVGIDAVNDEKARAERAEAAARDFAEALTEIRERHPTMSKHDTVGLIANHALVAHPKFNGVSNG